ncbi:MAG TPA: hypothetical protein VNK23_17340 [Candidatus Dormibacteraeota bacterium]|nr:hypothetical protein [Candidatus Dormibacteraeota bacterium]
MNHVLVVDDEAPMRTALEAHFARDGWDVTTAYGARETRWKSSGALRVRWSSPICGCQMATGWA